MNFKAIRISILLLILAYVGVDQYLVNARATNWKHPLRVLIYPINADNSPQTAKYISSLRPEQFADISATLKKEAIRYGIPISTPLQISLTNELKSRPPKMPKSASILSNMRWSLSLRYWAWKEDNDNNYKGITPHIRVYALFHDPRIHKALKHSTGLKNGKLALVNLFASKQDTKRNNVVVFHELLHTLGATDKYNLQTGYPTYPDGFAYPQQKPLFPQKIAEIMGGRIAHTQIKAEIPSSVTKTLIGPKTAKEIGW